MHEPRPAMVSYRRSPRNGAAGHNRPLVIRSEFALLVRGGWLVYVSQLELRFGSSRPEAASGFAFANGCSRLDLHQSRRGEFVAVCRLAACQPYPARVAARPARTRFLCTVHSFWWTPVRSRLSIGRVIALESDALTARFFMTPPCWLLALLGRCKSQLSLR